MLVRIVEMMHLGSQKAREGSLVGYCLSERVGVSQALLTVSKEEEKRSKEKKGPENGI